MIDNIYDVLAIILISRKSEPQVEATKVITTINLRNKKFICNIKHTDHQRAYFNINV